MRVLAIVQLCLAFSLMLWVLAEPFTGEYFATRSSLLLFQTATGKGDKFVAADKLQRHAERFAQLSPERQETLLKGYRDLEKQTQRSFASKAQDSAKALLLDLPPFAQAWLVFSVAIAILLLLSVEGAAKAAWLLPIITLCYVVDDRMHYVAPPPSADERILPNEEYLTQHYGSNLLQSWQRYLVVEWAGEEPREDAQTFALQVEAGEHALTVARIEAWLNQPHTKKEPSNSQIPFPLLALYLLWNFTFALLIQTKVQAPVEATS